MVTKSGTKRSRPNTQPRAELPVTFTKNLVDEAPLNAIRLLKFSWALYLTSLFFGVWVLMALTGSLAPVEPAMTSLHIGWNVRLPAMLQIFTFLIASLCVIQFGIKAAVKGKGTPPFDAQSKQAAASTPSATSAGSADRVTPT